MLKHYQADREADYVHHATRALREASKKSEAPTHLSPRAEASLLPKIHVIHRPLGHRLHCQIEG
jgi:hypothetical protein